MTAVILTLGLGLAAGPPPQSPPTPAPEQLRPDPGWKVMGRNLWFDPRERRAVLRARVVLREGILEHLMCRKGTKEHEAILATDAEPRLIHATLLATGAEVGHPVEFAPKFRPPAGSAIAIELRWLQDGKTRQADARQWVRDEKTKAPLAIEWVFAGSYLDEDRITKKTIYAADDGDLITVANFGSSILDLPIASSSNDADRMFTVNTPQVPPLGTEVFMVLGPRRGPNGSSAKKGPEGVDRPANPPRR